MTTFLMRRNNRRIALPERDQELLQALWTLREATFADLRRLVCAECASDTSLWRSLTRLTETEFLQAKRLHVLGGAGRPAYCWILGRAAVPFLAHTLKLPRQEIALRVRNDAKLSELYFGHRSLLTNVRISLMLSCRQHGYRIQDYRSDEEFRTLKDCVLLDDEGQHKGAVKRKSQKVFIFPDAFAVVDIGAATTQCFLEAQNQSRPYQYRQKARAYNAYFDSGAFTKNLGYKTARVLAVTDTRARAQHLKEVVDELPHSRRFWSAAAGDVQDDLLGSDVWFVGGAGACERLV